MNKYKIFSYELGLRVDFTLDQILDNISVIDTIGVISPFCHDPFKF